MELTNEIEDILTSNCRLCPENNSQYVRNKKCLACPALEKLQEKGAEMGWKDTEVVVHDYPPEIIELAASNGIDRNTFNSRIQKTKWSYEKAATTPKHATRKKSYKTEQLN